MPSPDGCLINAMAETASMVGKCRAITTARLLTSSGKLLSRASSIRKPPAHSSALVLSTGMVMIDSRGSRTDIASLGGIARAATVFPFLVSFLGSKHSCDLSPPPKESVGTPRQFARNRYVHDAAVFERDRSAVFATHVKSMLVKFKNSV